jgi:plasmid stabilization system protein ParE
MGVGRREVIWAATAARALSDAVEFVARDSPQSARQVLVEALEAADTLAEFSERGRLVPEVGSSTARELFVYQYRLIYEIRDSEVVIIAFLHGARDFRRIEWTR